MAAANELSMDAAIVTIKTQLDGICGMNFGRGGVFSFYPKLSLTR